MQKTTAIIYSEEFSTTEVLKMFLSEFEKISDVFVFTDSQKVIETVSNNEKTILFADLSIEKNQKLDFVTKIMQTNSDCKIMVLSDNPSVELIIEVMRTGVKEFLPVPIIKNEFLESVTRLLSTEKQEKKEGKCKIISVFSSKGGLGKTSIATNVALELAKITKENVALIDLNFQTGDITTFLDLKPSFNISYMLENLGKINETFLLSTMERYRRTSLYVLADPPYFKQADNIKPAQITKLLETLKETFSYIIIDAEAVFDGKSISALDNSDLIFLVTVANLPALRNTQRCMELFDKLGYDSDKTKILVNRFMENDEIKENDIKKVLSKDIYWKIPNNYFAIMSAINKGVPVSEINPDTNVAQSYKELAKYISDNIYRQDMTEKFENILKN